VNQGARAEPPNVVLLGPAAGRPQRPALAAKFLALKSLGFPRQCFVATCGRNISPWRRNHFPLLAQMSGNSGSLSDCQQTPETAVLGRGDSQVRTISFILAFAFVLAAPSMAGVSGNGLPGVGTFSYNGVPVVVPPAPQTIVVAAN